MKSRLAALSTAATLFVTFAICGTAFTAQPGCTPGNDPSAFQGYVSKTCAGLDQCDAGQNATLKLWPSVNVGFPNYVIESCDEVTWDFGDGSTAHGGGLDVVQHVYAAPGRFPVRVSVARNDREAIIVGSVFVGRVPRVSLEVVADDTVWPESVGTVSQKITRSGDLSGTTIVNWSTAPAAHDLMPSSGQIVFAPGETTHRVYVGVRNDTVFTARSRGNPVIVSTSDGTRFRFYEDSWTMVFYIGDDDPQPAAAISDTRAFERDREARFTVTLSQPLPVDSTIVYTADAGTAGEQDDFVTAFHHALFRVPLPAGQTTAVLPVPLVDDDVPERDETFTIQFSVWSNVEISVPHPIATATIVNDDASISPKDAHLEPGELRVLRLDVGADVPVDTLVKLASEHPEVANATDALIPAGKHEGTFTVSGLASGTSVLRALLPSGFDNLAGRTRIIVGETTRLDASLAPLSLSDGATAGVTLSLVPPRPFPIVVALSATEENWLDFASTATIPAGGSVVVAVHARRVGTGAIRALTSEGDAGLIDVHVVAQEVPSVERITPSFVSTNGGTRVSVEGAHLTSDCVFMFGGGVATNVVTTAAGVIVTAPPNVSGTIDLQVTCGSGQTIVQNAVTYARPRRRTGS